jgi:uncharacterized protein YkwD
MENGNDRRSFWKKVLGMILKVFLFSSTFLTAIFLGFQVYRLGYSIGFREGQSNAQEYYSGLFEDMAKERNFQNEEALITPATGEDKKISNNSNFLRNSNWGGPELWEVVNKRRVELGVNALSQKDELCTIASIRLNELLELGKLDGHEGFGNLEERRPDLAWIFDKYNLSEFLAAGASSAQDTVDLWENTLAHKKLMTGGEYVWGCIYAQNSFAVAITAY